MASLREQRREKRIVEILQTALEVLGEKGHAVSMDQIAERALLTRVGLYQYFPDKPALVRAIREWKFAQLVGQLQAALESASDFSEQIRIIAKETIGFQDQNPALFRLLLSGQEPQAGESFEQYLALVVQVMTKALEAGIVINKPVQEMAGLLVTMSFSPAIKRNVVFGENHAIPPHLADLVAEVFLGGVMKSR